MSKITTDTTRIFEIPSDTNSVPVARGVKIYEGTLVGRTPEGYGRSLEKGDVAVGFAKDHVDNTGGEDGDKTVELKAQGKIVLQMNGITIADVGRNVYATDDNTFTFSMKLNSFVGKLIRIEKPDHGVVAFDFFANVPSGLIITEPLDPIIP